MLSPSSLTRFRKNLLAWFSQFQRDLPWRRDKDPYRVWLSEIMLQQTRVAAAIPYYQRFLEHFPTVQSLAQAPPQEVLRLWAGLGYYSRARNLQKGAQEIVAKHHGVFPQTEEQALALPGIGAYTAAAILSIAYGKKLAVLDGNVARVLARLGAVTGDLRSNGRWPQLQQTANTVLDPRSPGDWNQALMELGATLCTPRSPQCFLCPVAEFCEARKLGLAGSIPEKRKKRATIEIVLASLVLLDPKGRTLLLPPPKSRQESTSPADVATLLSRMWHFPTIQVRHDAELELRQHARKLFPSLAKLHFVSAAKARHAVTFHSITILPFVAHVPRLPRPHSARSLPLANLSSLPISNLTRKVARSALLTSST
ncbi:MAG TPA: A/G-specific adenine glycosylase [Candidatus Acidoferrum sp.]|jgi:A/G-specific adenine glycosylase